METEIKAAELLDGDREAVVLVGESGGAADVVGLVYSLGDYVAIDTDLGTFIYEPDNYVLAVLRKEN